MKQPYPSLRRPARLLAGACLPLLAALGASSAQAGADVPMPSYAMKDGHMLCRSHLSMDVRAEDSTDQRIQLTWKGRHYLLERKPTSSGAYHFDDAKHGLVMIQIPAKSMLFDRKDMTRLADDCNPVIGTPVVASK